MRRRSSSARTSRASIRPPPGRAGASTHRETSSRSPRSSSGRTRRRLPRSHSRTEEVLGMAQGQSIHIGLNHVDPNAYNGWDGALSGCINDANDMQSIAQGEGFSPTLLIDDQATAAAVISAIGSAAQQLSSDDILVITYS